MKTFNPEKFVAIGEALAAGFGPLALDRSSQRFSFPNLIAEQFGVPFPQPLFEPPGIGNAPGFAPQPVILPGIAQTTLFDSIPPVEFANLSVPGMTLAHALSRPPRQPLIVRDDAVQTACNLILGGRRIAVNGELLTQVECAARQQPTGVLIALGFTEVLDGAITGDLSHLPSEGEFGDMYERMVKLLLPATLLLFTVPDPFDTPFFLDPAHAGRVLRVEESWLRETYKLGDGDFLRLPAVHEIGFQIFGRSRGPLPSDAIASSELARAVSSRIAEWNSRIRARASTDEIQVFDLNDFANRLRTDGLTVGEKHLTADYLGGLYGLNGCYFGQVGHGAIANEVLALLRQKQIDLTEILPHDPAAQCEPARGSLWPVSELAGFRSRAPEQITDIAVGESSQSESGAPLIPLPQADHAPLPRRLTLPAGLTQELPLDHHGSYFGDGIAANSCEDPVNAIYGGGGHALFGGVALVDSHLNGTLRFDFEPISADRASFRLYFDSLIGDDAVLTTPVLFRMPFQKCSVSAYPAPDNVSTGEIDLNTGEVSNLRVYASFGAIALQTLVACNPNFPSTPLSFVTLDAAVSPLEYSSAWARFEQRSDGKLDFTFYGTRFVPLGPGAKWPLNFCGPDGGHSLIPASGTVMHPHLRLSTKPEASPAAPKAFAIPPNCVRELTFHTNNTAFGDGFDLRIPEFGGPVTGRSHILGRASVQFGIPSGGTIPAAIRHLPPGGIFSQPFRSPISESFPIRLGPGPKGFDQNLRFPRATFSMEEIALIDDPFDFALAAVDLKTGFLFSDHLHRAFIEQDVINALIRVEPRVRQSSFFFRGPGVFSVTDSGALMFRFLGDELLPFPAGLGFPQPDFTSSVIAGPGSTLDPYLWIRAIEDSHARDFVAEGSFKNVVANIRDEFSCEYRIPADPAKEDFHFRYTNNTQLGSFHLHSLAWVGFGNSALAGPGRGFDTLTFSGFGIWEKNGVRSLEQAAVHIWKNPKEPARPYVGIQIAMGDVSNVDIRPVDPKDAQP